MYAKVFSQIFDSSISEDYTMRHVFMDLLVLATRDGEVDMTVQAISRRTNVPIEIVTNAIWKLCQPDPHSRTGDQDGRRLVPLDPDRAWGWVIVNYKSYRDIRDEEARKAYFREFKRKQRLSTHVHTVSTPVLDSPTLSTHTDTDAPTDTNTQNKHPSVSVMRKLIDQIYQAYPRKVARSAALRAIEKAIKMQEPDEAAWDWLLKQTQTFARSPAGNNGNYTPHPATWFNQQRYLDDPKEWQVANGNGASNGIQTRNQRILNQALQGLDDE